MILVGNLDLFKWWAVNYTHISSTDREKRSKYIVARMKCSANRTISDQAAYQIITQFSVSHFPIIPHSNRNHECS